MLRHCYFDAEIVGGGRCWKILQGLHAVPAASLPGQWNHAADRGQSDLHACLSSSVLRGDCMKGTDGKCHECGPLAV